MRNSNIFPDGKRPNILLLLGFFWSLSAVLPASVPASHLKSSSPDYLHDEWESDRGFPGGAVYAIDQTADGYLWLGSETGLVRFDGVGFRVYSVNTSPNVPEGPVQQLVSDRAGALWIRQRDATLRRYREGLFQTITPNDRSSGVTAVCRSQSGALIALTQRNGVFQYDADGAGTPLHPGAMGERLIISLAETSDGKLWMGSRDAGLLNWENGRISFLNQGIPDTKINALLPSRKGLLWIGTDNGLVRWDGVHITNGTVPTALRHSQVSSLLEDSGSNLWVGTGAGLMRIDPAGAIFSERTHDPSHSQINAIFEDRERNIWVGTSQGLERFRTRAFENLETEDEASSGSGGPVYVDDEKRIWSSDARNDVKWQRGATSEIVMRGTGDDTIYSISGRRKNIWVGRKRSGLTQISCTRSCRVEKTYTRASGLAQDSVYSVFESPSGDVWAGTVSAGVNRIRNGQVTTFTTATGLISNSVNAIAEDLDGGIWFATPAGLSTLSRTGWRSYTARNGLPFGTVNCLLADPSGVIWIGSARGLAFFRAGTIQTVASKFAFAFDEILGLAIDNNGALWIASDKSIFRASSASLLGGDIPSGSVHEYGTADGLSATSVARRFRSVIAGPDGRVWLSTSHGISVVEPSHLMSDAALPIAHVQTVSADGSSVAVHATVSVPAMRKRLVIGYIGLSLTVPERIRYRYKLEDFDRDWSEPTAAREAVYTNLSPGAYRFQVIASKAAGIWSNPETVDLRVEAALWQTWWFRLCTVLTLAIGLIAAYRLRLHQITHRLNQLFEERLSERTRIAQELHDTLLQEFLSASMQLHVAYGRLEEHSTAEAPLARAIELMGRASGDARKVLRGLRESLKGDHSLEQTLSSISRDLSIPPDTTFRLRTEGKQQMLRAAVRDDIYLICREAIVNALRHAKATDVEVEISYGRNDLEVLVQDNGCGMTADVLQRGADGHWGLIGMRERTEKIGAKLTIRSSPGAGTEVVLFVPGYIAFEALGGSAKPKWFSLWRLFSRRGSESN